MNIGAGLAIGVCFGVVIGLAIGNIAMGISIGVAVGLAFSLAFGMSDEDGPGSHADKTRAAEDALEPGRFGRRPHSRWRRL